MNYQILVRKNIKWIVVAGVALLAMRLFLVRELIAALLIFSVLFACIAFVVLILFALDHAWQIALTRAGMSMRAYVHPARRTRVSVNNSAVVNMLTPILEHRTVSNK